MAGGQRRMGGRGEVALLCAEGLGAQGHGRGHPLEPEPSCRTSELLQPHRAPDDSDARLAERAPAAALFREAGDLWGIEAGPAPGRGRWV